MKAAHVHTVKPTRSSLDKLAKQLNIKVQSEWYQVNVKIRTKQLNGRSAPVALHTVLKQVYPEFNWKSWLFTAQRRPVWNPATRKLFLDSYAEEHGLYTQHDWYSLKWQSLLDEGGYGVLSNAKTLAADAKSNNATKRNEGKSDSAKSLCGTLQEVYPQHAAKSNEGKSLYSTLREVYPQYDWYPWLFQHAQSSSNNWHNRKYLDWLADELGIQLQSDWYLHPSLYNLQLYNVQLLASVYPEFEWHSYMLSKNAQDIDRQYLDWLAYELQIATQADWYDISDTQHPLHHALTQLQPHLSIAALVAQLQQQYPEYDWRVWLFKCKHYSATPQSEFTPPENNYTLPENNYTLTEYYDWLADELCISQQRDWYVRATDSNMLAALQRAYPQYEWYPWLPAVDFTNSTTIQRAHLDWLADELCIEEQQQWYCIHSLQQHAPLTLAATQLRAIYSAVQQQYSEYEWSPWLFPHYSHYLQSPHIEFKYFEWLTAQLQLKASELQGVSVATVWLHEGAPLLRKHNYSLSSALRAAYPHLHDMHLPTCQSACQSTESSVRGLRAVFEELADMWQIETQHDWYAVTKEMLMSAVRDVRELEELQDAELICHVLRAVYPQFDWYAWCFTHLEYSQNSVLLAPLFDWLVTELQIVTQHDWYLKLRESPVLEHTHLHSIDALAFTALLKSVYPEFEWFPWLLGDVRGSFWSSVTNQRAYVDWLAERMGVREPGEWIGIPLHAVLRTGGRHVLRLLKQYSKSWSMTLRGVYPEIEWPHVIHRSSEQQQALHVLRTLFPEYTILENYRLVTADGHDMELDFFIPAQSLAFEYQGRQHYRTLFGESLQLRQLRDSLKLRVCKAHGIQLIDIPYWWHSSAATLKSLISSSYSTSENTDTDIHTSDATTLPNASIATAVKELHFTV